MQQQYTQALVACGDNEQCVKEVECTWIPRFRQEGNNFLDIGARQWQKMYESVIKDIEWFLKNDAAFVSRVHDPVCNKDMNFDREIEVRNAILATYEVWKSVLSPLEMFGVMAQQQVSCPPVKMGLMGNIDPFSKRPKHIKEYEDKNCKDIEFPLGVMGTITENCHFTKIVLGLKIGPMQLGFSYTTGKDILTGKTKDPIWTQNNNFDHSIGVSGGVAYKFGQIVELGGTAGAEVSYNQKGKATGYKGTTEVAGGFDFEIAKLGGKASRTWQLDSEGKLSGYSNSATASTSIGGNAPNEEGGKMGSGSTVNGEYNVTRNYDENGNYTGGSNSASVSVQTGATSNVTDANREISNQNKVFGLQSNQVIQVVAGQNQVAPWATNY